jgi:hypothetical protein
MGDCDCDCDCDCEDLGSGRGMTMAGWRAAGLTMAVVMTMAVDAGERALGDCGRQVGAANGGRRGVGGGGGCPGEAVADSTK